MRVALFVLLVAALLTQYPATAVPRAQAPGPPAASALDFEYFRTRVQPIFLAKREGHTRCVSCHSKGTPMRLQELSAGATSWTEEQSRMNFRVVQSRVVPNNLTSSKLLLHPLLAEGGVPRPGVADARQLGVRAEGQREDRRADRRLRHRRGVTGFFVRT
jgi:hypothetical protein